jgi:hypothetical protein
MQQKQNPIVRRPKSAITTYSINIFHQRNPLATAWWSLAYPGFGHFRLVSTIKGVFLFVGELLINTHSHLNMAIILSFTGHFAEAKEVLDTHLLLLYCGILIFAVWDSYRLTVEINKLSELADHEDAPLVPTVLTPAAFNSYDKRNPWVAAAWAALMPGLGHLYNLAIVQGFFLLIFGVLIIYFSHLLPAIEYTFIGQFSHAKAVVNWQWLLNFPSFLVFGIYDAYTKTVELNKIFDLEQVQYFRNNYQSSLFKMPV